MLDKIHGMIPPIITPLKNDESIDEEGLRVVVDFLVNLDVSGIFILGTAGEFAYMNVEERVQIAKIVRDQVKSRVPLLMGVSNVSLLNSLKLLKNGIDLGMDGFVATLPQYSQLESGQIKNYFVEIKKKCGDKPLFAYEVSEIVPTTARLTPKLILELANSKNINGLKYTGVLWEDYAQLIFNGLNDRESFRFFPGTEIISRRLWEAGVKFDGGIYSGLNVFPRIYNDMFKAIKIKDEALLARIQPLIFSIGGILSYGPSIIKEVLKNIGLPISTKVRSPLPSIKKTAIKKIIRLLNTISNEGYLDKY